MRTSSRLKKQRSEESPAPYKSQRLWFAERLAFLGPPHPVPQRPFGDAQISGHLSDCSSTAHQSDGIVLKLPVVTSTATIPVHGCSSPLSQPSPQNRGNLKRLINPYSIFAPLPPSTLPRSAGSTSASMATTSGHPNRSSRGFDRCEIRAPPSSMPLSVVDPEKLSGDSL